MSNTQETPGAKMVFIKPNIPSCWSAQPIIGEASGGAGTEENSALSDEIDKLKASKTG